MRAVMWRLTVSACVGVLVLTMGACARQTARPDESRPSARASIPDSSPLAKIKEGMGMKEVADLIGQPTDTNAHVTGTAFIPFYYGSDLTEAEAHSKGVGGGAPVEFLSRPIQMNGGKRGESLLVPCDS